MSIQINTFLIGVQKSATTSVYDWISQHPDVCGPVSLKDTPFFIDDKLFNKGLNFLEKIYQNELSNERIILNGSAHNIYFEHAIKRIKKHNPDAKLILILRNPVDRAISAYRFAVKRNLERDSFMNSIKNESIRLQSDNIQILSETTYIDHGRYYQQIKNLYKYFNEDKVLIIDYDDVKNKPNQIISDVFTFLNINSNFNPEFRTLNNTGNIRFEALRDIVYNNNPIKNFLVTKVLDKLVSYDLKYKIKIKVLALITKKAQIGSQNNRNTFDESTKKHVYSLLSDDIDMLENLIKRDLSHWKLN